MQSKRLIETGNASKSSHLARFQVTVFGKLVLNRETSDFAWKGDMLKFILIAEFIVRYGL